MKAMYSVFLASSLALTACGSDGKQDQVQANNGNAEQAPAASETLPAAAMIRVPVDANGVEDTSKVELRLDKSDAAASSQEGVVAAWDKGEAVDATKTQDELDGDSSSQSWFFYGGGYGRGYGYGYRGGYGHGYGYGYGYYPAYRNYGRSYYYNSYPSYYGHGGYNYYYYQRPYGC